MQLVTFILPALLAMGRLATAHFLLQFPTSIGYDDELEGTAPCGSFTPTDRSKGVQTWPLGGQSVKVITTHTVVTWEYKAALLSNPFTWVSLTPIQSQTGVGNFCTRDIPGYAAWVDQEAILQVIQHTNHGDLYQCAAIRFISGAAATPPASCTNSTGTSAHW